TRAKRQNWRNRSRNGREVLQFEQFNFNGKCRICINLRHLAANADRLTRLLLTLVLLTGGISEAAARQYRVEIEAPPAIVSLLKQHLEINQALDNPRLNDAEWRRLIRI